MELLKKAFEFYGLKEIVGKEHNPQIIAFFHELGYDSINDDETAWCSAILSYICKESGYEYSPLLNARSWLDMAASVDVPKLGDIVIFWRGKKDGWQGHVGIFINKIGNIIYTLGGNQNNQFNIKGYSDSRVLGYRRLFKSKKGCDNIVEICKGYYIYPE